METILKMQKRDYSTWILALCMTAVFMLSIVLFSKPASAAVSGLTLSEPKLVPYSNWMDASLGTWKKDDNNLYVLNAYADQFKLYYGPPTDPFQNYVGPLISNKKSSFVCPLIWMDWSASSTVCLFSKTELISCYCLYVYYAG
ncbi:hypothetical protein [Paenibacillus sp. Soil787]|uniref:hypothetical protein n=1 Tax=Paenibacillus sp. Soil787 TaxID=1736411 RepID=UPI000702599A|nr:hypothetical protein [Paenibacillus sp. Soil787]KRF18411.1 hypothetical protein ASG93_10135 [Paenibacillus sp. Soil787]